MNILVCSKDSVGEESKNEPCWQYLRSLGHVVDVAHPMQLQAPYVPDVMLGMGVTIMDETFAGIQRYPKVPLYCYNWDCYKWVWTNPRAGEYDYVRYGQLLGLAKEVWVPSVCTGRRTTQWWGITNWHVILSACPYWEHDDVRDDGYALCCLREIPDPWWGMFEKCCKELGIRYVSTRHEVSEIEYRRAVAHCRFICAPLYELSTGGLSLLEAYYHGKPVLLSDSQWNGGCDYLGGRAVYFKHGDVEAFKEALDYMYRRHKPYQPDAKEWIKNNYSDKRMMNDILLRIHTNA